MGLDAFLTTFNASAIDPRDLEDDAAAGKKFSNKLANDRARIEERLTALLGRRGILRRKVSVPSPVMSEADRQCSAQLGYEALQNLRGLAAHIEFEQNVPSGPSEVNGAVLDEVYAGSVKSRLFTHLIHHADDSGYYVPVGFPTPILEGELSVGSVQVLARELALLYAPLGSPKVWEDETPDDGCPWTSERWAWAIFEWLCRMSAARRLSIAFSG